jgi:hypothetical protein
MVFDMSSDDPFKPPPIVMRHENITLPTDAVAGIVILRHDLAEARLVIEEMRGKLLWMAGHVETIESDLWSMILFVRGFVYAVSALVIAGALYLYFN